jgi:hypothetical protein
MKRRGSSGYLLLSFFLWGVYIVSSLMIFGEAGASMAPNTRLIVGILSGVGLNLAAAAALGRYLRGENRNDA